MKAFIKIASCAMICLGLTVGAANAGVLVTNTKSVAVELIGTSNLTLTTSDSLAPVSYRPEVDMLSGSTVVFKMTGASFSAGTNGRYAFCSGTETVAVTSALAADAANVTLTVATGKQMTGSTLYPLVFKDGGDADPCDNTPTNGLPVVIPSSTSAGSTVALTAESSAAGGNASAVTLYNFANQFSASISDVTSTIDFATSMKGFKAVSGTPGSTATESKAGLLLLSNEELNNKITTGLTSNTVCLNSTMTSGLATLAVTVTGNFAEVKKAVDGVEVETESDGTDVDASAAITAAATSASVNITADDLKFCGTGASATDKAAAKRYVSITVDGTSTLVSREFKTAATLQAGTGAGSVKRNVTLFSATDSHEWQLDKSLAVVPYIQTAATMPTYCIVNNASSTDAEVELDVISSENGFVTADDLDLGTIPAKTTKMYTFSGTTVTPKGESAFALGVTDGQRYSARFNIMAPPNQVFINCIQQDPNTNVKRMVPVLTEDGAGSSKSWKN